MIHFSTALPTLRATQMEANERITLARAWVTVCVPFGFRDFLPSRLLRKKVYLPLPLKIHTHTQTRFIR